MKFLVVSELTAMTSIRYDVGPEMTDGSFHSTFNLVAEGTTDTGPGGASGSDTKRKIK